MSDKKKDTKNDLKNAVPQKSRSSGPRSSSNVPYNNRMYGFSFGFGAFLFLIFTIYLLATFLPRDKTLNNVQDMPYSAFIDNVKLNRVTEALVLNGNTIRWISPAVGSSLGLTPDKAIFKTIIPYTDATLVSLLEQHQVALSGSFTQESLRSQLLNSIPTIIIAFFFLLFLRQNTRSLQFGKSRARIYRGGRKATFEDVAGQEQAKKELAGIIDFLKNPDKYVSMGARISTGVLLVGSPGTGKTLLARAVAGEADVAFLHMSGSDFVEMFVGVGASRVRDLFEQARRLAPAIIFIDELDAVGRARGAGLGGGHDEREQTLNQMLVEMDGFETSDGVIVLAATNRPDVLDKALLRPGRFDRQVMLTLPDIKERTAILGVHARGIPLSSGVDLEHFARATPGMSGAELANLVNEAVLFAAEHNITEVGMAEFEHARDKILMGVAREDMVIPEQERKMTAYHEAGHALLHYFLKTAAPLHKVTIIPRGNALGITVGIPREDSYSHTKSWFQDALAILYGGYAAETIVYGETTTGTQNDLQQATEIARKMVCSWGMSPEIGAVAYAQDDEPVFMGRDLVRHKTVSEETARIIDAAVKRIMDEARSTAKSILTEQRDKLEALAAALIERETLSDSDVRQLLHLGAV
ncbi:MAG: ATP-dependent zinc metalloprotease FtsH [Spirochaetaceae bacterium]|jgi:cell division protease FtsH|nr:ATP-dependent zinc metalloprotease FtsH [Spirochaetaceae bacterium]